MKIQYLEVYLFKRIAGHAKIAFIISRVPVNDAGLLKERRKSNVG